MLDNFRLNSELDSLLRLVLTAMDKIKNDEPDYKEYAALADLQLKKIKDFWEKEDEKEQVKECDLSSKVFYLFYDAKLEKCMEYYKHMKKGIVLKGIIDDVFSEIKNHES